ncbi:MAG: ATP-binding protein [Coriobacteriia bacterium]|nr:ATP-binding protein [Coriobacteriia bacterium]
MRRLSLRAQVFLSILSVSLVSAGIVGLAARTSLITAFENYLSSLPAASGTGGGRRMGRLILSGAEQAFVSGVDRSVLIASLVAIGVSVVVALALAAYLARPIVRLEDAAHGLAGGDLDRRVDVDGPAEVAALGEAFNVMADSLARAEELRRRMTADVAHELRNPLAAARAQAEGMVDGVLARDDARLASLVEDLAHLSALIDDLQELAVAEAGHLGYDMRGIDLAVLVGRESERAEALLSEGVTLAPYQGPNAPTIVLADERRIAQVMRNLLSNAARHTEVGTVGVSLAIEAGRAVVSVIDTGRGIDSEDLAHVFERFYRADAARASDTGGAGLGLAISRTIIIDHGGEVFARSTPGEGTTVGFSLPVHAEA